MLQKIQTIHARHADVGDDGVWCVSVQSFHSRIGTVETANVKAGLFQCFFKHPSNRLIVVNDPDVLFSHYWSPEVSK